MSETESMDRSFHVAEVRALGEIVAVIAPGFARGFTVTVSHRFAIKEREMSVRVDPRTAERGAA